MTTQCSQKYKNKYFYLKRPITWNVSNDAGAVPGTEANKGRSGNYTGCRYSEGSRLHTPFLYPVPSFLPTWVKDFHWVMPSVCPGSWWVNRGFRCTGTLSWSKKGVPTVALDRDRLGPPRLVPWVQPSLDSEAFPWEGCSMSPDEIWC